MLRHPRWSCGISLLLGLCATGAASGRPGEERKAPAESRTGKVDRLAEEIALTRRYPMFGMTGPRAYRGYALGTGADLRGVDLKGALLSRARLAGADRFVIVSTRRWNEVERPYEFVVLTAFPVLWSY